MRATLADQAVIRGRVQIPAWGLWWAELETDGQPLEDNTVKLVINDLEMGGTIVTSGTVGSRGDRGRARYRVVGGSGGWAETIPAQSYTSDFQVRRTDVLRDAAAAAGELIDLDGVDGVAEDSLGNYWVRQQGPAARTLDLVTPQRWYVDLEGWTRFGGWPAAEYTGDATRMDGSDRAAGRLELAPTSLAGLLPGAVVDGLAVVDVEHRIADAALRTTVWGERGASSRLPAAFERLYRSLMAADRLRGTWEYRVISQSGERLDLQPVRAVTGLPFLTRVRVRLAPGLKVEHRPGSLVLVVFVDGSPSRPTVVSGDDPDSPGWLPQTVYLDAEGDVEAAGGGYSVLLNGQTGLTITGVQPGPGVTGAQISIGPPPIPPPALPARLKAGDTI